LAKSVKKPTPHPVWLAVPASSMMQRAGHPVQTVLLGNTSKLEIRLHVPIALLASLALFQVDCPSVLTVDKAQKLHLPAQVFATSVPRVVHLMLPMVVLASPVLKDTTSQNTERQDVFPAPEDAFLMLKAVPNVLHAKRDV